MLPSQSELSAMYKYQDGRLIRRDGRPTKLFRFSPYNYEPRTFSMPGRQEYLRDIVWTLLRGPIPDDQFVRQVDRDPENCRIENLMLVTRKECRPRGSVKLTPSAVQAIRRLYPIISVGDFARLFGVSYAAVRAVVTGHSWKGAS